MVRKSIGEGIDDCQTGNIFILALIEFSVQKYYYNPPLPGFSYRQICCTDLAAQLKNSKKNRAGVLFLKRKKRIPEAIANP